MSRTYTAKRLLEHGALTFREFHQITGWTKQQAHSTIAQLVAQGIAAFGYESACGPRRYALVGAV